MKIKLGQKGGHNFKSLNSSDIKYLFELYDDIYFNNQLYANLEKSNVSIRFFTSDRSRGICGLIGFIYDNRYYINIAPKILYRLTTTKPKTLKNILGKKADLLLTLQIIMECIIIYLLMIFGNFLYKKKNKTYDINGKLYIHLIKKYFHHKKISKVIFAYPLVYRYYNNYIPLSLIPHVYKYSNNSCYLDSLLTTLFLCSCSYYRDIIFETDIDKVNYLKYDYSTKKYRFINICAAKSKINNVVSIKVIAKKIQSQLVLDYKTIHNTNTHITSNKIRELLCQCLPEMRNNGRWELYPVYEVYSMIVELFPQLFLKKIPYTIINNKKQLKVKKELTNLCTLQIQDYMEINSTVESKKYLWESFTYPVLVLQHDGLSLKYLDSVKTEYIRGYEPIHKNRALSEYIINNKYRLFGVIVLQGVVPNQMGSGLHYIAYIRGFDLKWYYYNDINSQFVRLDKFPSSVFREESGQRPVLFFYELID